MKRGLVFGKYLPFHLGHKSLIDFALDKCDHLTVLVCCSNKETLGAKIRVNWIKETYLTTPNIEILALYYDENSLPSLSHLKKFLRFGL